MTGGHGWRIRLTTTAERDLRNILRWTAGQFGHAQARIYSETLTRAVQILPPVSYRRADGLWCFRTVEAFAGAI